MPTDHKFCKNNLRDSVKAFLISKYITSTCELVENEERTLRRKMSNC